jgi:ADP-Ribosyltransferase in polyvalent proteins
MKSFNANPLLNKSLAANGLPVKENFAEWFGGSLVVDAQGHPLVVYHGTGADIHSFDPMTVGTKHADILDESGEELDGVDQVLFYFSDDTKTADWYAKDSAKKSRKGANVMPVFLSMQNPLVVEFGGAGREYLHEEIIKAKREGHDGVIARNFDDGGVSDHYIAFRPEQVKSALGNSGLYLKDSPEVDDQAAARALELANAARAAIPKTLHRGYSDERFALVG